MVPELSACMENVIPPGKNVEALLSIIVMPSSAYAVDGKRKAVKMSSAAMVNRIFIFLLLLLTVDTL